MATGKRPLSLWLIVALALVFVLLAAYQLLNRDRYNADPHLLAELKGIALPEVKPAVPKTGDWPQWRGPERDGISRETGLLTDWPESGPSVLWQQDVGWGYSSVAVATGRAITQMQVGDQEAIVCWDAETGQEKWRFSYPGTYSVDPAYGPCPRATPSVDGDRVYTIGGNGLFHCLQAESGKLLWKHDLVAEFGNRRPQWGVASSPLVDGKLVYAAPGGPGGNSVAAFDKMTGALVWKAGDDPPGYSSPIIANLAGSRQLLVLTGTGLLSLSPENGQVFWRFPWETAHHCNAATPIVRGDYVFISSGYGKGCALLKMSREGDTLHCDPVYQHNQMCNHFASSVLYGEHLYGFNEQALTCMDFRTGTRRWKEGGFGKGTLLVADGHLIVLSENGKLVLARATPEKYEPVASSRVVNGRCWTVPVLAGGRLHIRGGEKLLCLELNKP